MKTTIFILFTICIVSISSELAIRLIGYKPGIFTNYDNFNSVDSLYTLKNYITDDFGIYKFSPHVTDSLRKKFDENPEFTKREIFNMGIDPMDGINNIYRDFKQLQLKIEGQKQSNQYYETQIKNTEWQSEFPQIANKIFNKKKLTNNWEKAIRTYLYHPFNSEGFRSIPFDTSAKNKIKILLLGDSFAYGMSAKPFFNSYSDILLSRGYIIYNTGISGTDPSQYAAVASKYIPLLNPDLVILNFYPGNDLMSFPRDANKNEPHEHMTNAGFFESNPEGKFLNPEEAYLYYLSLVSIPETNIFNSICSKSSILTILWGLMYNKNLVEHRILEKYNYTKYKKPKYKKAEISSKYINQVVHLCNSQNIPLLCTIIPIKDILVNSNVIVQDSILQIVFNDEPYYYPKNLKANDYTTHDDFHFSNFGALKYADFLDSLIQMQYIHSTKIIIE